MGLGELLSHLLLAVRVCVRVKELHTQVPFYNNRNKLGNLRILQDLWGRFTGHKMSVSFLFTISVPDMFRSCEHLAGYA